MVYPMAIILVAFLRVALGLLTAVLFSTSCRLCTTLPTKRVDFPTRFLIAWSLPTLLEHRVRTQPLSELVSELTLHMEFLGSGDGAALAALAQVRPQYSCVFPFSTNFGRAWHC